MHVFSHSSCVWLTLYDPVDCSLPGSSIHGIFQARILKWVAISSSSGSSWQRDWTRISCSLPLSQLGSLYKLYLWEKQRLLIQSLLQQGSWPPSLVFRETERQAGEWGTREGFMCVLTGGCQQGEGAGRLSGTGAPIWFTGCKQGLLESVLSWKWRVSCLVMSDSLRPHRL